MLQQIYFIDTLKLDYLAVKLQTVRHEEAVIHTKLVKILQLKEALKDTTAMGTEPRGTAWRCTSK